MCVMGAIKELGKWKNQNIGTMKWTDGHVWVLETIIPEKSTVFMYKYVKLNYGNPQHWEQGYNRLADLLLLYIE